MTLSIEQALAQLQGGRNPEVKGGEKKTQQAANELRTAAAPAVDQQQQDPFPDIKDRTPGSPPEGVELVPPGEQEDIIPSYEDEDQEFLFGMTDRPNEPIFQGAMTARPQPPRDIHRYLGALVDAAGDPNAPPELFQYMRVLQDLLSE